MEPQIKRITVCATDPSKQASHVDAITGDVMAHDQIDTYTTLFKLDPVGKILDKTNGLLQSLGQAVADQAAEKAVADFEKLVKEKLASFADDDLAGKNDFLAEAKGQREKLDQAISAMDANLFSREAAEHVGEMVASFRFSDFMPHPAPADASPAEKQPEGGESAA